MVRVRAFELTDVESIQRLYSDPSVAAMTLQVPYQSREDIAARFAPDPNIRRLVAEVDGHVVGDAGLELHQRRRRHVGSIGMAVLEAFRSKGVGSTLLAALLDLADNWHALYRVELDVYTDNAPAIRLYEKFGFEIEGLHQAYAVRQGSFVDAYTMARLRLPTGARVDRQETDTETGGH
ncbi:MAG TPA: GNAT family N-acetyltransferase [Thermomicrobiales bacterium]|nr:GNAT family N-acetyltransferase [Thermomicrobiales bacterium]